MLYNGTAMSSSRQSSSHNFGRSPRGRKPIPAEMRRKTISVRVAAETYDYLIRHGLKAGREIDRLVKRQSQEAGVEAAPAAPPEYAFGIAEDEARDTITELARGLLALIAERGTSHLSREQIQQLDDDFTTIVNDYLATFKRTRAETRL